MMNRISLRSSNRGNNDEKKNEEVNKRSLLSSIRNDPCYICLSSNCQFISICCGMIDLIFYQHQ